MLPCFSRATSRPRFTYDLSHLTRKFYSTPSSRRTEDVTIACRSNGFITLKIHYPLIGSGSASPIIIYLPPGPVTTTVTASKLHVASALSTAASATVVQIDYRLSRDHKYPTCVHDVLRGYDWILEHLVPGRAVHRPGRNHNHSTPIAACGELIGGGLATMLALTECRLNGPRVAAAAVNEPIVDWVFPEEDELEDAEDAIDFNDTFGVKPVSQSSSRKPRKVVPSFRAFANNGILDANALLTARSSYFRNPADYFDPFASSVLFLRTAGMTVPTSTANRTLDEFAELANYEREDFQRQQLKLSSLGNMGLVGQNESIGPPSLVKKSYKRWPGTASGLKIPDLHVTFGDTSPLSDQAVELAMLVRKNIISQHKREKKAASDEKHSNVDGGEAFALAEKKVQIRAREGISFWDAERPREINQVAQWLRNIVG